jgi:hypothetical protein
VVKRVEFDVIDMAGQTLGGIEGVLDVIDC